MVRLDGLAFTVAKSLSGLQHFIVPKSGQVAIQHVTATGSMLVLKNHLARSTVRMVNMFMTTVTSSSGTRRATHTAEFVAGYQGLTLVHFQLNLSAF